MDKSWIDLGNRISNEYMSGIDNFLDFAFSKKSLGAKDIYCPCKKCANRYQRDRATVKSHCIEVGFEKNYKNWTRHGEKYISAYKNDNNDRTTEDGIETDYKNWTRHRKVRCLGQGLAKSTVFGKASTSQSISTVRAEFEEKFLSMEAEFSRRLEAQQAEFSRRLEAQQAEFSMQLNTQQKLLEDLQRNVMQLQGNGSNGQ